MIRSLLFRLLFATSIAIAALLAVFGVVIYTAMRHQLLADFDASLLTEAKLLSNSVEQHGNQVHAEFESNDIAELSSRKHPQYFQLRSTGIVIAQSNSLSGIDLPVEESVSRLHAGELILPDSHRGRAAVFVFTPQQGEEDEDRSHAPVPKCTLTVAGTPLEAENTLAYLSWLLVASCAAATGLSGAVLMFMVGHGIRPVKTLAREIDAVHETNLSFRFPARNVPTELVPVIDKLNLLFERLEQAFSREQAMTADVAHELRTPLAGLLTSLEVCRSRDRQPTEYQATIDDCLAMIDRMQKMTETLLLLSRSEGGHLQITFRAVAVAELLRETWGLFRARSLARSLQIHWSLDETCNVFTDASYLRIVIQNLFDNAVSYADEGGTISIRSHPLQDRVTIQIANSGSTITSSEVNKVFDRFWRADSSRSDTGLHCGLGLSLSQRLVVVLGGTFAVESELEGTFTAILSLPVETEIAHAAPLLPALRGR